MKGTILQRARRIVFHPLIFATFPILSLFVQNMGKGYLREAVLITAGVLVLCLLLWLLVDLLVKDATRSAIIVSAFFFLFLSFGHALSAANALLDRTGLSDRWWILVRGRAADLAWVILWILLFALVGLYTARRLKNARTVSELLNIVALALVVMLGVNFFTAGGFKTFVQPRLEELLQNAPAQGEGSDTEIAQRTEHRAFLPLVRYDATGETQTPSYGNVWLETSPSHVSVLDASPDIYYIILDMYIRSDYLSSLFHYDNSDFLSFLEDKGFYIARESTSNYPYTTHSLASSLNYMYLNDLAEQVGQIRGHGLSAAMIGNSRLFDMLQDQGYTTVAFATGYWFTELKDSDIYMEPTELQWSPSEFQAGLIGLTPLSRITVVRGTQDDIDRQRVLYALEHIPDVAEIDAPTLLFAHINAPHDPYVFRADGQPVASKPGYTHEEYLEAYREQAAFVTWKTQQMIEEILRKSPEPPIIIVQSDHGAWYRPEESLATRMSILNVYYFPDQGYEDLYQTISPVNSFRIVLNRFFGTDYELLDDINYYASPELPYDFVDVTDEVSPGH